MSFVVRRKAKIQVRPSSLMTGDTYTYTNSGLESTGQKCMAEDGSILYLCLESGQLSKVAPTDKVTPCRVVASVHPELLK